MISETTVFVSSVTADKIQRCTIFFEELNNCNLQPIALPRILHHQYLPGWSNIILKLQDLYAGQVLNLHFITTHNTDTHPLKIIKMVGETSQIRPT